MATTPNAFSEISDAGVKLPKKPMQYGAQVVWCIVPTDLEMRRSAESLHGKCVAGGKGARSKIAWGLHPDWPELPEKSDDIRLYVHAHGVLVRKKPFPPTVKIDVEHPTSETTIKTAPEFFRSLQAFVQKAPAKRVRRISLVMCNAAGIKGEINVEDSFARELADLCEGLTVDLTARRGEVLVVGKAHPKATIDEASKPFPNPLFTVMIEMTKAARTRTVGDGREFTTALISLRDDEEIAVCRGYQRNPLTLSTRSKSRTTV